MLELDIHSMKIIDLPDPKRVGQKPKEVEKPKENQISREAGAG